MSDSSYIFEADSSNFQQIVLEHSQQVPVLVDFWADWCQPCQMLMPILSKLAEEMQGAFILVKVNSDANQELAMQFGVRSLPTVKVFKNGEIVDEFMGVQPEPVIRELINKHRTRASEGLRQQAFHLYQTGEIADAADLMQQVVEAEPDYYDAVLDLVEMRLAQGQTENLEFTLQTLPADQVDQARLQALSHQLKMIAMKSQAGDLDSLKAQLAEQPDNLQLMLDVAKASVAYGEIENGLALYFKIMQKDRQFEDDAGRKGLLATFEILDKVDPLIKQYRNKMFSLLH